MDVRIASWKPLIQAAMLHIALTNRPKVQCTLCYSRCSLEHSSIPVLAFFGAAQVDTNLDSQPPTSVSMRRYCIGCAVVLYLSHLGKCIFEILGLGEIEQRELDLLASLYSHFHVLDSFERLFINERKVPCTSCLTGQQCKGQLCIHAWELRAHLRSVALAAHLRSQRNLS